MICRPRATAHRQPRLSAKHGSCLGSAATSSGVILTLSCGRDERGCRASQVDHQCNGRGVSSTPHSATTNRGDGRKDKLCPNGLALGMQRASLSCVFSRKSVVFVCLNGLGVGETKTLRYLAGLWLDPGMTRAERCAGQRRSSWEA